jgi:antitoxin (DNA-binding transcriptional repressor) of toxin-antitoxin stability system
MTSVIDATETTLPDLLKILQAGDSVVLTTGEEKTPIARVEAIPPAPASTGRLGFLSSRNIHIPASFFDPLPEPELRLWEGEAH